MPLGLSVAVKGSYGPHANSQSRVICHQMNTQIPMNFCHVEFDRTKEIGRICGWAPQVEVLAHRAIGGFVSHRGWNSILESFWFGVPIATWPMYAEQQINAFQMVRDLELAVELRLDYRMKSNDLVLAEEIERAVRCVMDGGDGVKKRVEEMSEKFRRAVMEGGSSFKSFGHFIEAVLGNIHEI